MAGYQDFDPFGVDVAMKSGRPHRHLRRAGSILMEKRTPIKTDFRLRAGEPFHARASCAARSTALLVDHRDEVSARLISELEKAGVSVRHALSAGDASRIFRVAQFDLVVANVHLPDESGWLMACKFRLAVPALRILLYKAWVSADDEDWKTFLGLHRLVYYRGDLHKLATAIVSEMDPIAADRRSDQPISII